MALRSRSATVSARPSTSSGPGTKSFEKPSFDKRISRDDLSLALKSSGRNVRAYHIPVRGRLPSPETSPRSASLNRVTTLRTATPESLAEGETGVIAIGMALGSPSQAPEYVAAPWETSRAMPTAFPLPEPVEDTQSKTKTRKWGIFGRSKSKRGRPENRPQRSMTDSSHTPNTSVSSGAGSFQRNGGQVDQDTRKTPKHKPIVIRSQTEPMGAQVLSKEAKPSKELSRKTSTKSLRGDSSKPKKLERPPPASPIPPVPQLSGPFLNVEIPTITMDRYSVMFGDVLQSQQPASSLLARRQATLDRLKTINDEIVKEGGEELPRPRRATSPQPKNSPTFSLFPTTPGGARSSLQTHKPSPRSRSNTSPAMLHSPCEATFEEAKKRKEPLRAKVVQVGGGKEPQRETKPLPVPHAQPVLVSKFNKKPSPNPNRYPSPDPNKRSSPKKQLVPSHQPSSEPNKHSLQKKQFSPDLQPPPKQQLSPNPQPSPFTPDTSSLILESPDNTDDESPEVHIKDKLKPTFVEPAWEMISPPTSTASSSPNAPKKPSPPSSLTSPEEITVIKPIKPAKVDPDEALSKAVEISIARQISVSHQQRRMLRPLQNQPSRRTRRDGSPADPLTNIPVGKNERLAETKSATPTLVHPEDMADSPDGLLVNRKSSMVVLEGA
ncbi:Fc.00g088570.m01.CDS01 [Cosmosporella sp. VM-42]